MYNPDNPDNPEARDYTGVNANSRHWKSLDSSDAELSPSNSLWLPFWAAFSIHLVFSLTYINKYELTINCLATDSPMLLVF